MGNALAKLLDADSCVKISKSLLKIYDIETAVLLGELCTEYNHWEKARQLVNGGYFYNTPDRLEEITTLDINQQMKALNRLKSDGIVETYISSPTRLYYKINFENLEMKLRGFTK